MTQERKISGQFVVPGERLGVIEEFMSGSGTYIEEGVIYSKLAGCILLDELNKEVSVYPLVKAVKVPQVGSIVAGQVQSVQNKRAILRINKIGKNPLTGFFSGLLHISLASPRYKETMYDVCKSGDIMRAKVISDKNRTIQLSTADQNLGVIHAFCSRCGSLLELKKQKMVCLQCGKIEMRKFALDYGSGPA